MKCVLNGEMSNGNVFQTNLPPFIGLSLSLSAGAEDLLCHTEGAPCMTARKPNTLIFECHAGLSNSGDEGGRGTGGGWVVGGTL